MKKRIFSRVLALFMALAMLSTTALADVSFDDLQEAINGAETEKAATEVVEDAVPADKMPEASEPEVSEETPETTTDPTTPTESTETEDTTHVNGALVRTDDDGTNYFGYGWSSVTENENTTWSYAIEAHDKDGNRYVVLLDDVSKGSGTANGVVIGQDGSSQNVTIDMKGHNITGNGEGAVITVKENAELNLNNGTISGGQIGIDVLGTLTLDNVTVTKNGTGIKIRENGKVTFNGDNNKADVELTVGDKTYWVDADTAKALMTNPVAKDEKNNNWLLFQKDDTYIVAYTGSGDTDGQLTKEIVWNVLNNAKKGGRTISGFAIPEGVTSIGKSAFENKTTLRSVNIPKTLTNIGDRAFTFSPLETVTIPKNVTSIGDLAFSGCKQLTTVAIFSKTVGEHMFSHCSNLSSVSLSECVKEIGEAAFYGCSSLTDITFPSTLTTIGKAAFINCGLTELLIPENVTTIYAGSFNGCKNLTDVEIYGELDIPKNCFINNTWLKTLKISGKVKSIGDTAFAGCGLESVEISSKISSIGYGAFSQCRELESITIAEGLTTIGIYAFDQCGNMTSIDIPDTVTTIDKWAFRLWKNLKTITFPAGIEKVGDGVLLDTGVKSIWIPFEERSESAAKIVAEKTDANIFIKENAENLSFCRDNVFAAFGHYNADADVNLDDGSVSLTNVSGTIIAGDKSVILPDVAGITASIDTDGKITLYVPGAITVGDENYPYGADVTVDPKGNITADPHDPPPDNPPVISFDFDAMDTGAGTTIEDEEIPLAGLVTLAELLEALREYEGIEDVELPEDFQWIDHDYAQAIYWGLDEALVVDTEDDPLDPDEIVTVALLREVLENFVEYKGVDLTVTVEGEDDMIVMDLGERLTVFYGELEATLEGKAA